MQIHMESISKQVLEILSFVTVKCDEDEEHDGEGPHRRTTVADERKRDTDDRHKADCHAYVDEKVHEYAAGHAVAIYAGEGLSASFGIMYDPPYQEYVQEYD